MKYFITGATGFIGERLAMRLAENGNVVHALVRSTHRAKNLNHQNIVIFEGDILDIQSIDAAMRGCDFAFHLAAYARVWSKDKDWPHKINVQGTVNVFETALKNKLQRVVFTSTGGTLEPSDGNQPVDENPPRTIAYFNEYESTKAEAEKVVPEFEKKGLDVVIVNPTRVYGPGLITESNAMTTIIRRFNQGKWYFIPGDGSKLGNYVFVEDVVYGHLLAMEKGRTGQRYILGGENITYDGFFQKLKEITSKDHRLFHVPYWLMFAGSNIHFAFARLRGRSPRITPRWIRKYLHHWAVSVVRAETELGYCVTPFDEGLQRTVDWLNKKQRNDE
ncbi:MAG: SDR family oxidoreductase [Bacteroidales bacterium]|nr:SDR family oxidoreductase [Bacteroidales bacterium]